MRRTFPVLLILIAASALAGTNVWTTSGPQGAYVQKLSADPQNPDILFAQTVAGIYRSSNAGGNWISVNEGLPITSINAFAVGGGQLFAAIDDTIWMSADGGDHWSQRGNLGTRVSTLEYERRSGTLFAAANNNLLLSRDDGLTWRPAVPAGDLVYGIVISATSVFATNGSTVSKSSDGGNTWNTVTGLPATTLFANQDASTLYVSTGQTVFVSTDDAKTWTKLPLLVVNDIRSIVPAGPVAYASTSSGTYVFTTAGGWTRISTRAVSNLTVVRSPSPRIYASPDFGIAEFVDGDWLPRNDGLPGASVSDVAMSDREPSTGYACTSRGLFVTADSGASWNRSTISTAWSVAVNPVDGKNVYVATNNGVMKSSDRGLTWKGVLITQVRRLEIAHSDPATLYAVFAQGLVKTTDGGVGWSVINSGLSFDYYDYYGFNTTAMTVNASDAKNVAVAKYSGLFVTSDGQNWAHPSAESNLRALAFDSSSALYAGKDRGGLIKSVDAGATWSVAGLVDKRVVALTSDGTRIYAGTADGSFYRSDDGGEFWSAIYDGLSRGSINRIVVDATGQHLYTATAAGVYQFSFVPYVIQAERFAADRPFDDYFSGRAAVIPVVGKTAGAFGAVFTTDVTLSNYSEGPQRVVLGWLPLGGGTPAFFRANLPVGDTIIRDINDQLTVTGVGSLAIFAMNGDDAPEPNASVDGAARIWNHPMDRRAPFSQDVASSDVAPHGHAIIDGIAQDAATRVNVGVVNLSASTRQFTIQINGEESSGQIAIAVPPLALLQVPLPDADYGASSIEAFADDSNARWVIYASAIDRSTGAAQTFIGH